MEPFDLFGAFIWSASATLVAPVFLIFPIHSQVKVFSSKLKISVAGIFWRSIHKCYDQILYYHEPFFFRCGPIVFRKLFGSDRIANKCWHIFNSNVINFSQTLRELRLFWNVLCDMNSKIEQVLDISKTVVILNTSFFYLTRGSK